MTPGETGFERGSRPSGTCTSPGKGQGQKGCCAFEDPPEEGGLGCPVDQRRALTLPQPLCRVMGPRGRQADLSSLHSVSPMSSGQVRTSDAYLLFYELASPPSRM